MREQTEENGFVRSVALIATISTIFMILVWVFSLFNEASVEFGSTKITTEQGTTSEVVPTRTFGALSIAPTPPIKGHTPPRIEDYDELIDEDGDNDTPIMFFLHIQKSGGSTVRTIVWNNVYTAKLVWFGWVDYENMLDSKKRELRNGWKNSPIVMGHFLYGAHYITEPRPYHYMAIFRNAFDRTVSNFYWLKTVHNQEGFWDSISGWIRRDKRYYLSDNHQVRVVCGPPAFWVPRGELTEEHLECAKNNVKSFKVVLINEAFSASMKLLEVKLGWSNFRARNEKVVLSVSDAESSPESYGLDARAVADIKRSTQLDKRLYEYAVDLFLEDIQRYDISDYLPDDFNSSRSETSH